MQIKLRLLIIISLLIACNSLSAQRSKHKSRTDSVLVRKGSRVTLGNISFIAEKDTIIFAPDSVFFRHKLPPMMKSKVFYDSLEFKAKRSKFTKSIYDLTFISQNRKRRDTVITMKSETPFLGYEGKIIRNIRIKRLDVFGPTLYDTTLVAIGKMGKMLNSIHYNSRLWVIKQNLHIKKGDRVNALIMAENERILRELPYIEDALISISTTQPTSDSVDILIMTKDLWSMTVVPIVKSSTSATFRIYDANILGLGHKFSNKIGVNTNQEPVVRYKQFSYDVQNIQGSFIRGFIEYTNDIDENTYYVGGSRPFIPPILTVAGGIGFKRTDRSVMFTTYDTIVEPGTLKYDAIDVWAGKTFPLNIFEKKGENKTYFTLSGKYGRYVYIEHQEFDDDNEYKYENRDLYLASISISRNNYYLTNLIYSFGKTEDIPYGYNFTYTIGEKFGEYGNTLYTGLKFSSGFFNKRGQYLYANAEYGGYISGGSLHQGLFSTRGAYISKLTDLIGSQLRNFVSIRYMSGIGRYNYEKIYLNDKNGFRGVGTNEALTGIQRLTLNVESVLFTPIYFFGFRFAAFGYIDNGFISFERNILNTTNYFMGLGLGLRIRNENLIFKTFQIDFSFYPIAPDDLNSVYFSIKSVDSVRPWNFNPTAPGLVRYR